MPPLAIAAGIGAIGTIGGALIGGSAQSKAAKQANAAQQEATQAQLTLGRESMALNREIYDSNREILSPFVGRGNVAGDQINALLGLPSQSPTAPKPAGWQPGAAGGSGVPQINPGYSGPLSGGAQSNPGYQAPLTSTGIQPALQNGGLSTFLQRHPQFINDQGGPDAMPTAPAATAPAGAPAATGVTGPTASSAFENFANSAGMQFQLKTAQDAINHGYAGAGALQSGAAMKAISDRSQDIALNNYFMPYMGLLGGQQAVGAGAASAVAGVGTNFGNTAANINAGMGANIQNGANAASNAALLRGQSTSNMWGSIGGALGGLASSFVPR